MHRRAISSIAQTARARLRATNHQQFGHFSGDDCRRSPCAISLWRIP